MLNRYREVAPFWIDVDEAGVMFVGLNSQNGWIRFVEAVVGVEVGDGFEEE